ncbi:MAG: hypothetical protein GY937_27060 [bacterium]|nr:hypothetical protein [bacterium]
MDQHGSRRFWGRILGATALLLLLGLLPQAAWSVSVTLTIEGGVSSSAIASVPALSPWTLKVLYESTQIPTVTTPVSAVYQGAFDAEFSVAGSTVFVTDASLVIVEDATLRDAITFEGTVSSPLTIVTVQGSDWTSSSLASTDLPSEIAGVSLLIGGTLTIEDIFGGLAVGQISQVDITTVPEPRWLPAFVIGVAVLSTYR